MYIVKRSHILVLCSKEFEKLTVKSCKINEVKDMNAVLGEEEVKGVV